MSFWRAWARTVGICFLATGTIRVYDGQWVGVAVLAAGAFLYLCSHEDF